MAKKPAITATIAATPPFATKELAGDEVVGEEAAELAAEEPVGPELVALTLEALADGVDAEAPEDAEALDAPDATDDEAVPLAELGGAVNGMELGVALAPVGERLTVEKEMIKNRALNNNGQKHSYQQHILAVVTGAQPGDLLGSSFEYKNRRRLGIDHWCTSTSSRC